MHVRNTKTREANKSLDKAFILCFCELLSISKLTGMTRRSPHRVSVLAVCLRSSKSITAWSTIITNMIAMQNSSQISTYLMYDVRGKELDA